MTWTSSSHFSIGKFSSGATCCRPALFTSTSTGLRQVREQCVDGGLRTHIETMSFRAPAGGGDARRNRAGGLGVEIGDQR
jgi:hypothetical protein